MKRNLGTILLLIGAVALLACAVLAYNALKDRAPASGVSANESLPQATDFTMTDRDGKEVSLSDYAGKPVIVNFWATWCGPCKEELPYFEEAYEKYGEQIQFLMVDLSDGYAETPENAIAFAEEHGYPVYPGDHRRRADRGEPCGRHASGGAAGDGGAAAEQRIKQF